MGLKSKDPIVFPYKMSALLNAMGMIWNFTLQNPIAIPQRMVQGHYRNGMGLLHTITLMDTMGNIWNFTKYVGIPQRMFSHHMVSLWDRPIPFPYEILQYTRTAVVYVKVYIRESVSAGRLLKKRVLCVLLLFAFVAAFCGILLHFQTLQILWGLYGTLRNTQKSHSKRQYNAIGWHQSLFMGVIWELTSHIKAMQCPYISHMLSHTIPIFGLYMSHINSFDKADQSLENKHEDVQPL